MDEDRSLWQGLGTPRAATKRSISRSPARLIATWLMARRYDCASQVKIQQGKPQICGCAEYSILTLHSKPDKHSGIEPAERGGYISSRCSATSTSELNISDHSPN